MPSSSSVVAVVVSSTVVVIRLFMAEAPLSVSDWAKGIGLSVLASLIGGASKLAIRQSWLLQQHIETRRSSWLLVAPRPCMEDSLAAWHGQTAARCHPQSHNNNNNNNTNTNNEDDESLASSSSILSFHRPSHRPDMRWAYGLRMSGMLGMTIFNPLCCVCAMNYASPSILAPLSGLTLVWIIVLAGPCIGEPPTRQQMIAAALLVVGEVVVAVFGDHVNDTGRSVAQVLASYHDPAFVSYMVGTVFGMALLASWIMSSSTKQSPVLRKCAWGVSGGIVTGFQNFLKDTLTILKASQGRPLPQCVYYALIPCAVLTALGGLLLLTACMKRYDAAYSSTMFVGSFVVSASVMSAIHYHTFDHLPSRTSYIMYPMGLIILMTGVGILVAEVESPEDSSGSGGYNDAVDTTNDTTLLDTMEEEVVPSSNSNECPFRNHDRVSSASFSEL
jgi:drug/metabolite transporter (DMT)-like permease